MALFFRHITDSYYVHHKRDTHPNVQDFPLGVHDAHEFCYFIAGSGKFFVESNTYDLYPGCVILIRSGEVHRIQVNPSLPYERIAIEFSPGMLDGIDPEHLLTEAYTNRPAGQENLYTPDMLNQDLVHSCMFMLSTQFQMAPNSCKPLIMRACLSPVLLEIHRAYLARKNSHTFQKEKTGTLVSQLIDYMNTHLCEDYTLDSLAEMFFTSKTHLNNQFKQATGFTIWKYTITKRLAMARQYIRDGMPAGEAALSSGWKDYSSFYRSYKAQFGVAPITDLSNKTIIFYPDE
ncbi:MAG: AraC family transcriptional regulator [Candidatus Howiella sp.]